VILWGLGSQEAPEKRVIPLVADGCGGLFERRFGGLGKGKLGRSGAAPVQPSGKDWRWDVNAQSPGTATIAAAEIK
jgi:hypothetical protein